MFPSRSRGRHRRRDFGLGAVELNVTVTHISILEIDPIKIQDEPVRFESSLTLVPKARSLDRVLRNTVTAHSESAIAVQ